MIDWADLELHEGDCLDPILGLAMIPDLGVDVVITDPPYEAACHGNQRRRIITHPYAPPRPERGSPPAYRPGEAIESAPLGFEPITDPIRVHCGAEWGRIAKRWVVVFTQTEAAHLWIEALEAGGLDYVRTMVWIKPDAQPQYSGDRPGVGFESIVVAHRSGRKRWNGGGRVGVFSHTRERGPGGDGAPHPTTKPLPLMRELVSLFSEGGELVCDPFAGSGSTGVACRELGRRFVGWEIDPTYAAIARRRLAGEEAVPRPGQPSLF